MNEKIDPPICPYCQNPTKKVRGHRIYPNRTDLWNKKFYLCSGCDSYVGCHKDTGEPFGTPANRDLRRMRIRAHSEFDKLWKEGNMTRGEAYSWLATSLGISKKECHIGSFTEEQCQRVVELCGEIQLRRG